MIMTLNELKKMAYNIVIIFVVVTLLPMTVGQCPHGKSPYMCFANPCTGHTCEDVGTKLTCRADYCIGCDDRAIFWVDDSGKRQSCTNVITGG